MKQQYLLHDQSDALRTCKRREQGWHVLVEFAFGDLDARKLQYPSPEHASPTDYRARKPHTCCCTVSAHVIESRGPLMKGRLCFIAHSYITLRSY